MMIVTSDLNIWRAQVWLAIPAYPWFISSRTIEQYGIKFRGRACIRYVQP